MWIFLPGPVVFRLPTQLMGSFIVLSYIPTYIHTYMWSHVSLRDFCSNGAMGYFRLWGCRPMVINR